MTPKTMTFAIASTLLLAMAGCGAGPGFTHVQAHKDKSGKQYVIGYDCSGVAADQLDAALGKAHGLMTSKYFGKIQAHDARTAALSAEGKVLTRAEVDEINGAGLALQKEAHAATAATGCEYKGVMTP